MENATLLQLAEKIKQLRQNDEYDQILELSDGIENKLYKLNEVDALLEILKNRVISFIYTGGYEEAFSTLFRVEHICSTHPSNTHYSLYYGLAGILYTALNHYDMAKEAIIKSVAIAEEQNKYRELCYTYSNLANLYFDLNDYEKSLYYMEKSLNLLAFFEHKEIDRFPIYGNSVIAYAHVGNVKEATYYFEQMKDIVAKYNSGRIARNIALIYDAEMALQFARGEVDLAIDAAQKAKELFVKQGDMYMVKTTQRALINYYRKNNDILKLAEAQAQYIELLEKHEKESYNRALLKFQLEEKKRHYKMQSYIDPLTQIYNRGYIEHQASTFVLNAMYKQQYIGCIIFDIDRFKQVNDQYGHLVGDDIIKFVAQNAAALFDDEDAMFARYGGDEFIAYMRDHSIENIENKVEKLHAFFNEYFYEKDGETLPITISVGAFITSIDNGEDFTTLLKLADEKLYEVKQNGRDSYLIAVL